MFYTARREIWAFLAEVTKKFFCCHPPKMADSCSVSRRKIKRAATKRNARDRALINAFISAMVPWLLVGAAVLMTVHLFSQGAFNQIKIADPSVRLSMPEDRLDSLCSGPKYADCERYPTGKAWTTSRPQELCQNVCKWPRKAPLVRLACLSPAVGIPAVIALHKVVDGLAGKSSALGFCLRVIIWAVQEISGGLSTKING